MSKYLKYVHQRSGQKDMGEVWVKEDLCGKHREYCLCFSCKKLNITDPEKNCSRASLVYALCRMANMVIPVWECPDFSEKNI